MVVDVIIYICWVLIEGWALGIGDIVVLRLFFKILDFIMRRVVIFFLLESKIKVGKRDR